MSSDQVYRCCLRVFRGHWSRNVSSRRKCDCFSGCFIRIEIEKPHKVITCREYSKISFHNIKVQRVRKCWCSLKTGESDNNKHRKNCECCPGHSLRDGVKKSKWKFKMAFAMKGGGSRGGLECHIPILKNDFFKNHLESFPDCENVFCT